MHGRNTTVPSGKQTDDVGGGGDLSRPALVETMLRGEKEGEEWEAVASFCETVMLEKEAAGRVRERSRPSRPSLRGRRQGAGAPGAISGHRRRGSAGDELAARHPTRTRPVPAARLVRRAPQGVVRQTSQGRSLLGWREFSNEVPSPRDAQVEK